MHITLRASARFIATAQLALMSSCGESQGQETGKDPRVPISIKQPQNPPKSNNQPNLDQDPSPEDETDGVNSGPKTPTEPTLPLEPIQPPNPNDPSSPSVPASPNTPSTPTPPTQPNTPPPANSPSTPSLPDQPPAPLPPLGSTLTVKINGLHNEKGNVCLSLFNSPDGFPDSDSKAILAECFSVIARSFEIKIENVPSGTYAIALWHDENRDKKLNYNFLGIPKEGLAFSERGKPRITPPPGPPSFNSIAFEVRDGVPKTTETQMTYLLDLL